eukprot:4767026-Alexandrium_andersonii.AAC.1
MARALNLMVAANFRATDGVWSDVRLSEAAVGTSALRGNVGSVALARKPRQLSPVDSVTSLALDETDAVPPRSWR